MNRTRKLSLILAIVMFLQLGLSGWSATGSVTAAPAGPVALSFYPADNLTTVPLGANLRITFDENIKFGPSTAQISIYKSLTNEKVESLSYTSNRVQISANKRELTIDPTANLEGLTDYYVLIDSNMVQNESNNAPYAGIHNATVWNFRTVATEDVTKPVHTMRTLEGAGPFPITSGIVLTFNENVYAAGGFITLAASSQDDTRYIPVTSSSVTGSGTAQITITPEGALLPNSQYTVSIGNDNFQDASGNTFNSISWSFTTATAPVNLAANNPFSPADDSTLVSLNTSLTITFDQNVQANAGKNIEIRRVSDNVVVHSLTANSSAVAVVGSTATITPPASPALAANTAYYVLIQPGAFSLLGNASEWFYGISAATIWNFTTGFGNDNSQPTVSTYSPVRFGTATGANTNLVLTFNKEVYPHSGNIEIRQSAGGTLFRSIPITSSRVKGGGTKQITIDATSHISSGDPAKSFVNNTKYYVTMGNRALKDAAGNFFGGISGTTGWEFTITQDGVRPTLTTLNPVSGASAVDVNAKFTATFNKPIAKGSGNISFIPASSGSTVFANYDVDPTDNKRMVIEPPLNTLTANTNYYINIDEGAITDLVGNSFIGILNQHQWTFLTKGGDNTAPTVLKSEVSGSIIRLIYNEPLDATLKPSAASYYVTVAGAPRNVTDAKIEGNMVLITLSSSVGYNQKVVLSYTKPTNGLVTDLSGNQAASLSKIDISNGFTSTNPVVSSGSASGNTVVLNFSETLMSPSAYAYTQFSVSVGGTNYSTTSIWHSGNTIQLSLSGTIPSGQSVLVSYSPGSYPIIGISGNSVSSFSGYNPNSGSGGTGGTGNTGAPYIQHITAIGSIVTIKYNKSLNVNSNPGMHQYVVLIDSQIRTVSSSIISGDSVILTLSSAVTSSQTVRVTYTSSYNTVMDYYGNIAPSFTNITANSGTGTGTGGTATMQGAILKGSILTMTFGTHLDPSYVPSSSFFLVRVKGMVRSVTNVQIAGSTVILTLASPAKVGEQAEVSYLSNTNGLRSTTGQLVNIFSNANVANQTTIMDSLTGDYEAADGEGVGIKTSGSTISSDTSPAGVSANRYTVSGEKFLMAVTTSKDAGLANPRIVFKVPDYDKAALVSIPVVALEMASKQGGDVTFAVQHGDATYELPLKTLNFTELSRALNGSGASNQVLIAIDRGASAKTSALTTALNSSKATVVAGPVNYEVMVTNGSNKQEVNNFSGYVSRSLKTSTSVTASQTAAVWLDPVTGTLSYVPTVFKTEGGVTTATFKRKGNSAYALVRNTASFSDMNGHWAGSTVHTLARKFIVEGLTVSKYEPNKPITRGEFATYIAKGLGLTGDRAAAAKFKDVNKDTVMGAYIGAAASAGIVYGATSTSFKPNSYITRQDMAAMMMRAAKVAGMTVKLPSTADSYLQKYTDKGKVSSYAKTNMALAVYLGIINGKSPTILSPETNASRAEGAVMLLRLLEKAEFLSK